MKLDDLAGAAAIIFSLIARFGFEPRRKNRIDFLYEKKDRRRLRVYPSYDEISRRRARITVLFYCLLGTFITFSMYFLLMDFIGLRQVIIKSLLDGGMVLSKHRAMLEVLSCLK